MNSLILVTDKMGKPLFAVQIPEKLCGKAVEHEVRDFVQSARDRNLFEWDAQVKSDLLAKGYMIHEIESLVVVYG